MIKIRIDEAHRLDVIRRLIARRLTQAKAGELLGLGARQVRRLRAAFERLGASGLASRKRGRTSNHRLPDSLRTRVLDIVGRHYPGLGPTAVRQKLQALHGVALSKETLRKWM